MWAKGHVFTQKFDFAGLDEAVSALQGKPVYLTVDLDVLDSSVFPGTGTPEAGGVTFRELIDAIIKVSGLQIVAFDANELCPSLDTSGASTAAACKVLRELLLAVCKSY
ncbi:Agmatinase [bioreactor metagenome]|uniref:Agmatinase n=1 Tax=bioreactor metagenome TaxID=1076179 RepID=A0A645AUK4_9ZZZZ